MADMEINLELKNLNSLLEKLNDAVTTLSDKVENVNLAGPEKSPKVEKSAEEKEAEKKEKEKAEFKRRLAQAAFDQIVSVLTQLPTIAAAQVDAARNLANQSGTTLTESITAQKGAREVIGEQAEGLFASIFGGKGPDPNKMLRLDEFNQSFAGLGQAVIGMQSGTELSTLALTDFQKNAKGALNTETFKMTPEVFRAMAITGMKSTQDLQKFREAAGLSSLRADMMASAISKNVLAFQLFGNSFAKTAIQADRLGISLQSVTSAATANVMNPEGLLDTVNQLNALGANIDFTELLRLQEFEGLNAPQKILEYLRSVTPTGQFSIGSFKGLFEQMGFKAEDVMRVGKTKETTEDLQKIFSQPIKIDDARLDHLSKLNSLEKFGEFWKQYQEAHPYKAQFVESVKSFLGTAVSFTVGGAITSYFAKQAISAGIAGGLATGGGTAMGVGLGAGAATGVGGAAATGTAGAVATGGATAAAGIGAAGLAAIAGTIIVGTGAGLLIGDLINKATGGATLGDWWKYNIKGAETDAEEARLTQERIRKIQEDAARARGMTVEQYVAMQRGGTPTTSTTSTTPTTPPTATTQAPTVIPAAQTEMITNTNRLISKTEELVNVLKTLNLPELTNAIKTSEKTLEINIDGQRVTIPGVGLTGTRYRSDTSVTRR